MTISTKGRYALSFLIDIRANEDEGFVTLNEAATRQGVSEKYLEHIAKMLVVSGFLGNQRGKNGGYFFRRKPEDISVGEILRTMEGDLAPAPCVSRNGNECKRKTKCSNIILWKRISEAVNLLVDNITLEDMYGWQQKKIEPKSV